MKKKFLEMLRKKEARKTDLAAKADKATTVEELRNINSELDTLNTEIAELRSAIDELPDEPVPGGNTPPGDQRGQIVAPQPNGQQQEQRGQQPTSGQIIATYAAGGQPQQQRGQELEDPYGTLEYRNAFMNFAKTGKITPELRADAMTTTADVSAVIPSTILNEVIKKMTVYGQVFARVRKLNIKGGVTVPILSLKPSATWIGEAPTSDKQKVQANTNVTFAYYGLECKVSTSLLADTVTLTGFEGVITDLIMEAMIKAVDTGVISGNGTGKMLGITADTRVTSGQKVTLAADEFGAWDAWKKKVFAKMPLAYKAGAIFLMASGTFEGYIDGMVDANGQPIGRVNYGITNGAQERFGGKEIILVEDDIIANYDDASAGDVVAIYLDLRNYAFNSNMQMTMYRYFDHDTNEWIDKAILIADGKLIDPYGVVIVKKGA